MKALLTSVLFAIMLVSKVSAQPTSISDEQLAKIDTYIQLTMEDLSIPGAAVAIIDEGQVVHMRGFGKTTFDGSPITADTPFRIASNTKTFTALAMMLLVQDGEINLDDAVVAHLPWFEMVDKQSSEEITIRHLLSHRSGISTLDGNILYKENSQETGTFEYAVRQLSTAKLQFSPGTQFQYSNANYRTLGQIIETVSGLSYSEFMRERIFTPLYMQTTTIGPPEVSAEPVAIGHRYWFGNPQPYNRRFYSGDDAGGGVFSSANDLSTYLRSYLGVVPSPVSPNYLDQMISPADSSATIQYGLGWFMREYRDFNLIYHTGNTPGLTSFIGFFPDEKIGFVFLLNADYPFGTFDSGSILWSIPSILLGGDPKSAKQHPILLALRYSVLVIPFLLGIWVLNFTVKSVRRRFKHHTSLSAAGIFTSLFLPSVFLIILSYVLYFKVTSAFGAPLASARLFSPDTSFMLALSAYIALFFGLFRPLIRLVASSHETR